VSNNTVHKITIEEKHLRHPLMSERHNDVIDVITQKSLLKYGIKYYTIFNKIHYKQLNN